MNKINLGDLMKIYISTLYDNLELVEAIKKMVEVHAILTLGNDKVVLVQEGEKPKKFYYQYDDY
jgi:hypothetical protein